MSSDEEEDLRLDQHAKAHFEQQVMQDRLHLQQRIEQLNGPKRESQQIADKMREIENQIGIIGYRSKKNALELYKLGLLQVQYGNYSEVGPDKTCVVCT